MEGMKKLPWLQEINLANLTHAEAHTLLAMFTYSDASGENIFPSLDTLCTKTGIKDRRSVRRYQQALVRKGFIHLTTQGGAGRGSTNVYALGDGIASVTNMRGNGSEKGGSSFSKRG